MSDSTFILLGNLFFVTCCTMAILPLFFYNKKKK